MNRKLLYTAPLLLILGCGKGEGYTPKSVEKIEPVSVAAGQERTLYPMKEGNQWVFTSESGGRKEDVTIKVTSVRQEGNATIGTLETMFAGSEPRSVEMRVDDTGVYQLTSPGGNPYVPNQPLIYFPLEASTHDSTFSGPRPVTGEGPMNLSVKYVGVQEVDTDMGRMSAIAVESLTTWTTEEGPARSYAMTWWTPGIGFVRQRQEITLSNSSAVIVMKLKSYSFKP